MKTLINPIKKSKEKAGGSEARMRALVEHTQDIILEVNRQGDILYINRFPETYLGKNVREFLPPEQYPAAQETLVKVFDTAQSQTFELQISEPTGQVTWYSIRLGPVKQGDVVNSLTVIATDITTQKTAENALRESEERYRLISTVSSDYMFSSRLNDHGELALNWVAGAFQTITGYTREEYVARGGWVAALHPDDIEQDKRDIAILQANQPVITEIRTITKNNQVRWVRVYAHPIWDAQLKRLTGINGAVQDITERKLAEEKIEQSANQLAMLNEIGRAVAVLTDLDSVLETIHQQLAQVMPLDAFIVTLYDPETNTISHPLVYDQGKRWDEPDTELLPETYTSHVIQTGNSIFRLLSEEEVENDRQNPPILIGDPSRVSASMIFVPMVIKGRIIGTLSAQSYYLNAYTEEDLKLLEGVANQVAIAIENARLFTSVQKELVERKRAEERLAYDALHDALTGLPNRTLFFDRLGQRLEHARRHPEDLFAVLFIDLDRFKVVNDSLGHAVGDELLVATAQRLAQCLRPEDTVSRLSGDEFAILLNDFKDISDVVRVVDRIQARLSSQSMIKDINRVTTASIGITVFSSSYNNSQEMLRDADSAMYHAKSMGGGHYVIFDDTMYARAIALLQLEADLKRAVENQEWEVYYQPVVTLPDRAIIGVEALVRWNHPQRGIINPVEFIHVAEETGLILPIGEFVLRKACAQVKAWQESKRASLWVSVNLSGRQFEDQNLLKTIKKILIETGLSGNSLQLEITETVAMKDFSYSTRVLNSLDHLGIQISLDDFGNGYSSLGYLNRFPIKILKIDRSFIKDIQKSRNSGAIITAIVSMGHALHLEVVAEGVETEKQLAFLQSISCDKIQGFLIGCPVSAEQLERQL